jgi:hypothetical protein
MRHLRFVWLPLALLLLACTDPLAPSSPAIMPLPPFSRTFGPFTGVHTSLDPIEVGDRTDLLADLQNGLVESDGSQPVRMRPAFFEIVGPGTPGGFVQGIAPVDGAPLSAGVNNFLVIDGKLYQYNDGLGTFTDLSAFHAAIAVDPSAHVSLVWFGGQLIVSDGFHRPWRYNPATSAAAYLAGTTGPWYGRPVVYYAKLFAIRASDRTTIEWSEENDPDAGYEAAGAPDGGSYRNAWTLTQTSGSPLVALAASNDGLVFLRERGVGRILGAVTDDFRASGTFDGISTEVGAAAPFAVVSFGDGSVWWIDNARHVQRLVGSTITDLSDQYAALLEPGVWDMQAFDRASMWASHIDDVDRVVFAIRRTGLGAPVGVQNRLLVFDRATGVYNGEWSLPDDGDFFMIGGSTFNSDGRITFMVADDDGDLWQLTLEESGARSDVRTRGGFGVLSPRFSLTTQPLLYHPTQDRHLTRVTVEVHSWISAAAPPPLDFTYRTSRTPYGGGRTLTFPTPAYAGAVVKRAYGVRGDGRWLQVKVTNAPQYGTGALAPNRIEAITLDGFGTDVSPRKK